MADQNIYSGVVIDVNDPLVLGRVRAHPEFINKKDLVRKAKESCITKNLDGSIPDDISVVCRWTKHDPFCFLPLLPYHLNVTPDNGEYIHIFYSSNDKKFPNQFYLKGPISTPLASEKESFEASKNWLSDGIQDKPRSFLKKKNKDQEVSYQDIYGKYIDLTTQGIFPEPGDNALLSRGTTDVILRKNHLLLRSGKYLDKNMTPNRPPTKNDKRAFLQLSYFQTTEKVEPTYIATSFEKKIGLVKKLLEWNITNPDNASNVFNGRLTLYNVTENELTNTDNLGKDIKLDVDIFLTKLPEYEIVFNAKSPQTIITIINEYIKGLNEGYINIDVDGIKLTKKFNDEDYKKNIFPFVFRPNPMTYRWRELQETFPKQFSTVDTFFRSIKFKGQKGFGLVSSKDVVGDKFVPNIDEITPKSIIETPTTIGAMGADTIFLLSHISNIPGLKPIDLNGTIYGIEQPKFVDEIQKGTNSLLRGEKFAQIIQLLVRWIQTHVHPLAPTPPVDISQQGESLNEVLTLLANESSYMNKNIRIN